MCKPIRLLVCLLSNTNVVSHEPFKVVMLQMTSINLTVPSVWVWAGLAGHIAGFSSLVLLPQHHPCKEYNSTLRNAIDDFSEG